VSPFVPSVLAGHPSKNIAVDLGISRRTVESHRASIMKKARVRSLPELARLALAPAGGCRRIAIQPDLRVPLLQQALLESWSLGAGI